MALALEDWRDRLTVIVTTSPLPRHPCSSMIEAILRSLQHYGGVAGCRVIILADGYEACVGEGQVTRLAASGAQVNAGGLGAASEANRGARAGRTTDTTSMGSARDAASSVSRDASSRVRMARTHLDIFFVGREFFLGLSLGLLAGRAGA